MARPKEFDEAETLDQALELFRARGYAHTSFSDLVGELGIGRQSLYDTYGDKHALFLAALRRYLGRGQEHMRRALADETTPVRAAFQQLFEGMLAGQCTAGNPGCLMVNSMVELAPHDGDIRALAQEHARTIEGLFASRLAAAQRRGDLGPDKDPVALARFLYHTVLGLAVAARGLGDADGLRETGRLALRVLD